MICGLWYGLWVIKAILRIPLVYIVGNDYIKVPIDGLMTFVQIHFLTMTYKWRVFKWAMPPLRPHVPHVTRMIWDPGRGPGWQWKLHHSQVTAAEMTPFPCTWHGPFWHQWHQWHQWHLLVYCPNYGDLFLSLDALKICHVSNVQGSNLKRAMFLLPLPDNCSPHKLHSPKYSSVIINHYPKSGCELTATPWQSLSYPGWEVYDMPFPALHTPSLRWWTWSCPAAGIKVLS